MKKLIFFFSLIALLASCSNEDKPFYPDPFIFRLETSKDSIAAIVSRMQTERSKSDAISVEALKNGAVKVSHIYNHENSSSWAEYSLYLCFDSKEQISDIIIYEVYDQACVYSLEKWAENYFQHPDFVNEKEGLKKNLSPRWSVKHNDRNEYLMLFRAPKVDKSMSPCMDYAIAKTNKANAINRLNYHRKSQKPDSFGLPIQRAGDTVGEMLP